VTDVPETRYAKTADGVHLAYQVFGDGPLDLVLVPVGGSHVELAWEVQPFARVFRRLASFSRLIRFDHRGTGMSDPLGRSEQPSLEARAADTLAVLDAVGSVRAGLVANGVGGLTAIFFATSCPNRTASVVLDGCYARLARAADYPWGIPVEILDQAVALIADRVKGDPVDYTGLRYMAPEAMKDTEFLAQYGRYYRFTNAPAVAGAESAMVTYADVRALLPAVQAPTLVLYRRGDQLAGKPHAEYLADHISGSRLVELPGTDNLMYVGDSDADLDEIEEFLTGARHAPETDRVLATVLFTDIVGSTERASELGDRKWRELLDAHDNAVRRQLERFRGREVNTVGDGFVATFDGPGRAIQCACAIRGAVRALGMEVRVGVHTGEVEVRGNDVAGVAVHIGARVSGLADAGEVLVSSTVKDLVAGSGIEFEDRGEHELKGVPGTWKLYAVAG
jgi:class 3 adenylate cyclase/alpha-beta hydrolase superfamily lysophospholipase